MSYPEVPYRRPLAVVTGATGGIGSEICVSLSLSGYSVVAHYGTQTEIASQLKSRIHKLGGECHTVASDLGIGAGICELTDFVSGLLEADSQLRLQVLVNNAAKLLSPHFGNTTLEDFDQYFAINTRAPFFISQQLSALMFEGGSIVNISSASAHFSSPGDIAYAMSKAAVESLTKNMAEAVAPAGIRVNTVVPGFTNNGYELFSNSAALEYMSSFSVLGGVADPADVAAAVSFLTSNSSRRITGTILDVTGGSTLGARGGRRHSVRDVG